MLCDHTKSRHDTLGNKFDFAINGPRAASITGTEDQLVAEY